MIRILYAAVALAAAYAVTRIRALGFDVALDTDALGSLGWGGYLAVPLAFTAGQLWRVYTHARGIRKGGTAHVLGWDR